MDSDNSTEPTPSNYETELEEPETGRLYCICRKTDTDGQLMVGCESCDEWYHFKCLKIPQEYKELIQSFSCINCDNHTIWYKKCRLDDCFKKIEGDSKYCSKEHGLQYLKRLPLQQLAPLVSVDFHEFKKLGDGPTVVSTMSANDLPEVEPIMNEYIERLRMKNGGKKGICGYTTDYTLDVDDERVCHKTKCVKHTDWVRILTEAVL